MSSQIVIIGPADALPGLRERLAPGAEVHTFTEAEALEALEHITTHKPRIVALEQEFSASSRGAALVKRLKADPALADCEVRVVADEGTGVAVPPAVEAAAVLAPVLDRRGTRRAPRVAIAEGVEALVDGAATRLVDLSPIGAQVLSPGVLRPNQRVRLTLTDGPIAIRCQGTIAWASFEMPKGQPTRYRAGIEFTTADADALLRYIEKHAK